MSKARLDLELVNRGLLPSRARARDAVLRGVVTVNGTIAAKASMTIQQSDRIELSDPASQYVSRAALKLKRGLEYFDLSPAGRNCVDVGASTGGFTQVLLEEGASAVFAFDVGHGQLHPSIAEDPRVISREGLNARDLTRRHLPFPVSFLVGDVSFISLTLALPAILSLADPGSPGIFLIKPQFEVGKGQLGKGGIVNDPELALASADKIADWLQTTAKCSVIGLTNSPISGGDGNQEFLIAIRTPQKG
uniref:TlyA family RNA methyltransferase n=1 Tax=Pararhizobium sp. IMCC3301 TaxID=3067904 RepID=UPI0027414D76|nr:TlyA family RNA methyltransferase [Pararhizobium sp. IMCC3301]